MTGISQLTYGRISSKNLFQFSKIFTCDSREQVLKTPSLRQPIRSRVNFRHAILLNIRALEPALSTAGQSLGKGRYVMYGDIYCTEYIALSLYIQLLDVLYQLDILAVLEVLGLLEVLDLLEICPHTSRTYPWKVLRRISRQRFLYRDLISQRKYHAIPQQWFERPKTSKSTSLAQKFVKDGVMNERSRKISVMSWRCGKCGEFGIQRESNIPLELLFSLK